MERKIGEVFEHEGVKLEVVEAKGSCGECHAPNNGGVPCGKTADWGFCSPIFRSDRKSVFFRKVEEK